MHKAHPTTVTAGMNHSLPFLPGTRIRAAAMLCALLFIAVATAQASIRWATLEAIHQMENPRNLTRPGPFGELGPYQFRSSTWQMHTKTPFERALDRQTSDMIAVRHYDWLKRHLEEAHVPATPYNIALAWNGGLNAAIAGSAPRIAHDYAARVANLTAELSGARFADAQ
jgi:hypothetical protein